jgi:hypothetical protein
MIASSDDCITMIALLIQGLRISTVRKLQVLLTGWGAVCMAACVVSVYVTEQP